MIYIKLNGVFSDFLPIFDRKTYESEEYPDSETRHMEGRTPVYSVLPFKVPAGYKGIPDYDMRPERLPIGEVESQPHIGISAQLPRVFFYPVMGDSEPEVQEAEGWLRLEIRLQDHIDRI